ncbi:MAG: MFS transporter, partial [Acidimicrobiia bacterium]
PAVSVLLLMLTSFGPTFPRLFLAAILQELSFVLMVHFPGYLDGLGVSEGTFGVLYAVGAVAALLLRPAFGKILDLTHRRTVLLFAGALNAAFVLSFILTSAWGPLLWVLFLAQRVLQIGLFTAMLTYAADAIPEAKRTQGLAIFGLSGLLPIALGGVLGDVLIETFGFNGLFAAASLVGFASWGLVWTFPLLAIRGPGPRRGFFNALAQRNLLPVWWITLSFAAGLETLFTFTRTFVDDRQLGSAGLFFGIYGLAAAVTRIFGGRSYDRIPQRPLVLIAIVSYGLSLMMLGLAQAVPLFAIAAVLGGMAHGAVFPVLSSSVIYRARVSERGSALSIFTSIFDIALLVFAPLVGLIIEGFSYSVAFSAMGGFLLIGGLVYSIWDKRMIASGAMATIASS